MALRLPTYGYKMTRENEAARLLGWIAAMRWLVATSPYQRRDDPFVPSDDTLHGLAVTWAEVHYGGTLFGLPLPSNPGGYGFPVRWRR